jgi:transposase-like protein
MTEKRGIFSSKLGGNEKTVEADEAYIQRDATKKLAGPGPQKAVFALVERGGSIRSFHVANVTAKNLNPMIGRHVSADSRFVTDEAHIYGKIGWNFASHETVCHSRKEYVRGDVHTNTVEGYFSILKRGIYGVYQHVSEAHLKRYLAEFDFRYNNRIKLGIDDVARADNALDGTKGSVSLIERLVAEGQRNRPPPKRGRRWKWGKLYYIDPRQMRLPLGDDGDAK